MPGEFSDVGSAYGLDYVVGRAVVLTARTTYIALLTAAPTDTSTIASLSEVADSGYARKAVTWRTPSGSPPSTNNNGAITFGPWAANQASPITHCVLVSSSSGTSGDLLVWWALDTAKSPSATDTLQFNDAQLVLSLT